MNDYKKPGKHLRQGTLDTREGKCVSRVHSQIKPSQNLKTTKGTFIIFKDFLK